MSEQHSRMKWHGFTNLMDFVKATISLGVTITALLWGVLTWGLDERYAPIELVDKVERIQSSVSSVQRSILQDQLIDTQERACKASGETKLFFARRLQELESKYQKELGEVPPKLNCEDLE